MNIQEYKQLTQAWFKNLQEKICINLEKIEEEFGDKSKFITKEWQHPQQGGGRMRLMRGKVFEKGGVNFSQVAGTFSPEFAKQIPDTDAEGNFWASGISIVIHPYSPMIPSIHLNTRFICTKKFWFGGGTDLTPMVVAQESEMSNLFHRELKKICDIHDQDHYPKYKKWCDEYFFLKHRNEPRGIGGIFYDYLNSGDFNKDFNFTKEVGKFFDDFYPKLVRKLINIPWSPQEQEMQHFKRGRYVEFNLLYDRGTHFGLKTNGNIEAIFMSMPPTVKW